MAMKSYRNYSWKGCEQILTCFIMKESYLREQTISEQPEIPFSSYKVSDRLW